MLDRFRRRGTVPLNRGMPTKRIGVKHAPLGHTASTRYTQFGRRCRLPAEIVREGLALSADSDHGILLVFGKHPAININEDDGERCASSRVIE
jgi:hypothetical protein